MTRPSQLVIDDREMEEEEEDGDYVAEPGETSEEEEESGEIKPKEVG